MCSETEQTLRSSNPLGLGASRRSRVAEHGMAIFLVIALLPPLLVGSVCWFLPIPDLGALRIAMAARDYTDIWAAGHLVALGKLDTLFDLQSFNAALRSMFGPGFPFNAWPYPPPTLLLAVPFSMLPLLPGFLLYTAGTVGLLWFALRSGGLTRAASAAMLFSPAVAHNALAGQNGSLIAATLFGGLSLVDRKPVLAGAILGALVIKPQFGLLVPLCLVAARHWRALLSMAVSASLLIVASGVLFGVDAWIGFFVHTRPMIATILEAPWQALPWQRISASALMAARSAGASLDLAYGFQATVGCLCATIAWRIWRKCDVDPIVRAALTGLLAVLASPWAHSYDMIPLAIVVVLLATSARASSLSLLGFAWFWPAAVDLLPIPLPVSMASVAGVAFLAWREVRSAAADTAVVDVMPMTRRVRGLIGLWAADRADTPGTAA